MPLPKGESDPHKEEALRRLVRLGDMMGDGLHLEEGGSWIEREYKIAMRQAGITPPRKQGDPAKVNEFMARRVQEEKCSCGGKLAQSRSGSFRAKCLDCGKLWQLGKKAKSGGK